MENLIMENTTIILIVVLVIFFLVIKGIIKTFKRAPVVAILCIIFLLPIYYVGHLSNYSLEELIEKG